MLPRENRLNLKKDFKWIASGKKLETKFVKLFIKFNDPSKSLPPRVGIALSGKNFKKAYERNRARRLISQAFQELYADLPDNINIVALPKTGVLEVKSSDVVLDLETVLKNI